jgi:metal-responsive CopG/Arc/MetJ family transcriptional regulator
MTKNPDKRFSISIDPEVAKVLDEHVAHTPDTNRSQVVEQAVKIWLSESLSGYTDKEQVLQAAMKLYEEQQEQELYRAYYAELSDKSRSEIAAWTKGSEDSAKSQWSRHSG